MNPSRHTCDPCPFPHSFYCFLCLSCRFFLLIPASFFHPVREHDEDAVDASPEQKAEGRAMPDRTHQEDGQDIQGGAQLSPSAAS